MDNTVCPHCGAPLKHDANGKIVYLRSYTCGSYGNLAIESDFTQSVSCMQAQIKRLQRINGELLDRQYDLGKQIASLEHKHRQVNDQSETVLVLQGMIVSLKESLVRIEGKRAWSDAICRDLVKRVNTVKAERNAARLALREVINGYQGK